MIKRYRSLFTEGRGHHDFTYIDLSSFGGRGDASRHSATNFVLDLDRTEDEEGNEVDNEFAWDDMVEDLQMNVLPEIKGFTPEHRNTWRGSDEMVLGSVGNIQIVISDNGQGSVSLAAVHDDEGEDERANAQINKIRDRVETQLRKVLKKSFQNVAVGSGWTSRPI